ncbi:MAG: hypothetical protein WC451_06725 [Patescibacteria group bacterium]|jgi:hypothetical protein
MENKTLNKLASDIKKTSIKSVALRVKIPYATLWRIVNNEGCCTMRTWHKIEYYYSKKRIAA